MDDTWDDEPATEQVNADDDESIGVSYGLGRGSRNGMNSGWNSEKKPRGNFRGGVNNDNRERKKRDDNSNGFEKSEVAPEDPELANKNYIPEDTTENDLFDMGNSSGINFQKYESIEVKVNGENVPKRIDSFQEAGLRDLLIENINKSAYKVPTPIQKQAIPIILAKRDLMACAQTGSGKTAAFMIPIIHQLLAEPTDLVVGNTVEPQAIIISPTRELAVQIYDHARKFAHQSILKVCIAYGGTNVFHQKSQIMRGCHILVATPGRINDFLTRNVLGFASIRFVVLDEADRMLDMGFLPEMTKVFTHPTMVPAGERQTLMFSATFPEEIQQLAGQFLYNYIFVSVGIVGGACGDVEQTFYQVDKFGKRGKLMEILREDQKRTLVFVETKRNADFLASFLSESDVSTTSIHGDRFQKEREAALRDFRSGARSVLVATSVAARGLDIKNVNHVINFDLPKEIDEYVHRIGRTGRVGNKGKATSFFDPQQDARLAGSLVRILKQAGQNIPDFLSEHTNGSSNYTQSNFGGEDIRNNESSFPQDEADDDWN